MIPSLVVSRLLVPEPPGAIGGLPVGFALADEAITAGLPHVVTLETGLTATLVVPTGLAHEWLRADGDAEIASSVQESQLDDSDNPRAARRAAPRLVIRGAGGATIGVLPLAIGVVRVASDAGAAHGAVVQIVVLAYTLRAGNVRGPGDWGGRITLGWRRIDRGTDTFEPAPLNAYVVPRLTMSRESLVGNAAVSSVDDRYERARSRWRRRRRAASKRKDS
jgi:hypothetical protein